MSLRLPISNNEGKIIGVSAAVEMVDGVITLADAPAALAAPILSVTVVDDDSVILTWVYPDDHPVSFVVFRGTATGIYPTQTVVAGYLRTLTVTGLTASTVYFFAVAAGPAAGVVGLPSNEVEVLTAPALGFAAPIPVAGTITHNSVQLLWGVDSGPPSGGKWLVSYGTTDGSAYTTSVEFETPDLNYATVTGLTPNTDYYFVLTGAAQYSQSTQVHAKTKVAPGIAGDPTWVQELSCNIIQFCAPAYDLANDRVVVGGGMQGYVKLGSTGTTINSQGSLDCFLGSFAQAGTLALERGIGGAHDDKLWNLTTDTLGNIYTIGYFQDTVAFDATHSLTAYDPAGFFRSDIWVAKWSPAGVLLWLQWFGRGESIDQGRCIKIDSNGDVIVAGVFAATGLFGSVSMTSFGGLDIFLAKMSGTTGAVTWAHKIGGVGDDSVMSIDLFADDSIAITGVFGSTGNLDGSHTLPAGAFLAKYDTDGVYVWSRSIPATVTDVAVDRVNSRVYLTGGFVGPTDFGGGSVNTSGNGGFFCAVYSTANAFVWAYVNGASGDTGNAVLIDGATQKVYLTGRSNTALNFGHGWLFGSGWFLVSFTLSGTTLPTSDAWARRATGGNSWGNGLALDGDGNLYNTGTFESPQSIDFGAGIVATPTGFRNGFLVSYVA
jgi:Fibronectin type III domain.